MPNSSDVPAVSLEASPIAERIVGFLANEA